MSNQLGAICRESTWADKVWPHLARYIAQASPLGMNAILALLQRAATAAKRGQDKISVAVWREVITKLLTAVPDTTVATPLGAPPQLDIGFLLTLSQEQMATWDAFLASVEKSYQAASSTGS